MGRPRTPDPWEHSLDQPWDVQITVVRAPPARVAHARVAGIPIFRSARVIIAVGVTLALIAAVVVDAQPARHVDPSRSVFADGHMATDSPYRYPLGCLGAGLAAAGRSSVGESRGAAPCWRYGVYVTAILREVRGVWQLGLEAVSPSCPAVSLPRFIRARLVVCRRPTTVPASPSAGLSGLRGL